MKPFGILCLLLLLNPGARGEHLTSQLSWVAAWLLVTCFCLFYLVYMYLKGFICHWERGELGKVGEYWAVKVWKVYEWSEVARWERWENSEVAQSERWGSSEVAIWERWEGRRGGGGGSEMARQERWESSEVVRWEIPCFILGWRKQGETKISSFCFWC